MMSQIFKSGFQKNENLDILKTKHCFSSNKRTITNQGLLYCKNNFVLEVTLKCQSTVVVLVGPLAAAGRGSYEIGSVHPSSWCLLGWGFFGKVFLFPKNCGNGPKIGFLYWKKNLVISFPWICSIMKVYIICYVPAQILCLVKVLFLRCGSKCPQPFRLQDF